MSKKHKAASQSTYEIPSSGLWLPTHSHTDPRGFDFSHSHLKSALHGMNHMAVTPAAKTETTYQHGYAGYSGGAYTRCKTAHADQPFEFGKGKKLKIYITAKKDADKAPNYPTFGLYFDSSWKYIIEEDKPTQSSIEKVDLFSFDWPELSSLNEERMQLDEKIKNWKPTANYPAAVIIWSDGSMLNLKLLELAVNLAIQKAKGGEHVEVGCIGAHGRTGTFLAALLIRTEGLEPGAAIEEVRKRHCIEAVERSSQIEGVFAFAGKTASKEDINKYK